MNPRVKALGETVLRVRDLQAVKRFYVEVIGLDVLREFDGITFLKVSDGYGGHTQIIGLFHEALPVPFPKDSREPVRLEGTSLHHFALEIDKSDFPDGARPPAVPGARRHDRRPSMVPLALDVRARPGREHPRAGVLRRVDPVRLTCPSAGYGGSASLSPIVPVAQPVPGDASLQVGASKPASSSTLSELSAVAMSVYWPMVKTVSKSCF